MKKSHLACIALAAPALLLAGCTSGVSRLTLSANWYANSDTTVGISGTYEELQYSVTFEAKDASPSDQLSVSYEPGVYTSKLVNSTVETAEGVMPCYYLSTRLEITGRYTLNGVTGEDFTDVVTSEAWFLDVTTELRPVKSVKNVLTHSAVSASPSTLEDGIMVYEYTYTTNYNADCSQATVVIDYTKPDNATKVEKTIDLSGNGSYLDNETILFAMRGVSTSAACSFRTINPVTQAQSGIGMSAVPTAESKTYTFSVNGTSAERTLNAYSFSLGYSGSNPGQPQELVYAAKVTDGNANTYRNVLLEMRVPVLQSLGTLVYRLTDAQFNDK